MGYRFLKAGIVTVCVLGSLFFIKETVMFPILVFSHIGELTLGTYIPPVIDDRLLIQFIRWGIAMLVLFSIDEAQSDD